MSDKKTRVQNERNEPTFYARIPKMCIMDLNPYELALYCNYKQTASEDGYCDKSNSKLAKETHMSVSKVKEAKKSLEDKKLITIEHRKDSSGVENQTTYIKIVDIWKQNHLRYAVGGSHQKTTPSHEATTGGLVGDQGEATKQPLRITSEEKPLKKKKSLTDLEQWQIRLRSVEPIMSAILAKMERGFDPAFHTPETYLNLALLEKYVPLAEEVLFYKPTPQQWFAFYGEVSQEYNRNGWTVGIKTVREKFPGYMARMNTAAQKKVAPQPSNITHVDVELTPAEVEARKQQLAAVLKSEAVS